MTIEDDLAGPMRVRTEILSGYADLWPNVVLGGRSQFAHWCDHVYASPGEPIKVLKEIYPTGIASNTVIGRIGRPGATEGTVISADGEKAVVSVGAEEITAAYNSSLTLVGGDTVRLLWQGSVATVLVKLTAYIPPPVANPGTTAPPPSDSSGELSVRATDSATWVAGLGWNKWAAQNQNMYQGTWGSTMFGSWFYNGATRQLAGANIVGPVRLRLPKRLLAGEYNSTKTLRVYVHTSDTRPGEDVTRIAGPYDFSIAPHFQGGWVELPAAVGVQLATTGGGISIAGSDYIGLAGKADDPISGQLIIPWSR